MSKDTFFDVVIIGSGAAGGTAAQIAANEGRRVALIETDLPGGDAVHYGEIPLYSLSRAATAYQFAKHVNRFGIRAPSVAYNYPSISRFKDSVIKEATGNEANPYAHENIAYFGGRASFLDKKTIKVGDDVLQSSKFLIATGSSNLIPEIPGLEESGYITYKEANELPTPPKSIIIIGAGREGIEYANLFTQLGSKVTLIEQEDQPLPREDSAVGTLLSHIFTTQEMDIRVATKVIEVSVGLRNKKKVTLSHELGQEEISADEIMVATGKLPNIDLNLSAAKVKFDEGGIVVDHQLQTTNKHVYAAGDVTGFSSFTHASIQQGQVAIHNILYKNKESISLNVVPRVYATTPAIACVGVTEAELIDAKHAYKAVSLPISISPASLIQNEDVGFVKLLINPEGQILGASIVSPSAWELIQELTISMQHNISVKQLAKTLHPFGSWSDAIRAAAAQL